MFSTCFESVVSSASTLKSFDRVNTHQTLNFVGFMNAVENIKTNVCLKLVNLYMFCQGIMD